MRTFCIFWDKKIFGPHSSGTEEMVCRFKQDSHICQLGIKYINFAPRHIAATYYIIRSIIFFFNSWLNKFSNKCNKFSFHPIQWKTHSCFSCIALTSSHVGVNIMIQANGKFDKTLIYSTKLRLMIMKNNYGPIKKKMKWLMCIHTNNNSIQNALIYIYAAANKFKTTLKRCRIKNGH